MFKRKNKTQLDESSDLLDDIENETVDDELSLESYEEYNLEDEDISEEHSEKPKFTRKKTKLLINIIFIILTMAMVMIATDVICVARYSLGPVFAIKTKTYSDGGTKEYYGLGYKVIKYNQKQGRRDITIGFWNMPYSVTPIDIKDIDLSIEFINDYEHAYNKYYKKFLRVSSKLNKIDSKKNEIVIGYIDEDKKYSLNIICSMANKNATSELELNKDITIIGTLNKFSLKTKTKPNQIYIENCFAEQ